jgi:hypothetical protein
LPPLRERRRAARSRNSNSPRELLPGATPSSSRGVSYVGDDFPAPASNPLAVGIFQLDFGSTSEFDWPLGMFQDPLLPFDPYPNANDFMEVGNPFSCLDEFSFGIGPSSIVDSTAEPHSDSINNSINTITSGMNILDLASAVHPLPGLLAQFHALPASIESSGTVQFALHYYQTTLSLSNTTKDPIWSTSMVFLRLGSKRPLVMHLLLASSLKSLVTNQEVNNLPEMLAIAKHHFQMGAKLLVEELSNEVEPDHVNVMTAFWFLYLYRSRQANLNMGEMTQLSQNVGNYVRKHQLDRLCTDTYTGSASRTSVPLSHRKRSLLARLLIWIFYADVSFGFRYRGGSLAKYLSEDISRTAKVYETSKSVLHLHWGSEYPARQVDDDVQNAEVLEMLYRSFIVYQAVNGLAEDTQIQGYGDESIERRLIDIEENHSSIFVLANSAEQERSRLWQNADWVVSLFYAIRIYYFRVKNPDVHAPRPPVIEKALSSLIGIAYRTYSSGSSNLYRCPQWPLLIAGAETSDPIHRDWILKNMSPDIYKGALEKIIAAQEEIGGRIKMSLFREMCDISGSDDEVHRVNFNRIGFGAWC